MNPINYYNQYLEYCQYRKELDAKTLKAYRIDLRQYFDYIQDNIPDKQLIEDYITFLHKTYKQKTVKRKIASLKAFYNYLESEEIITETPFRKIKVKFKETIVLPRVIPRTEIEMILKCIYRHNNLRDISIIEMFFATGARVYEISNLCVDCVDLYSGTIRFMGKGNKERYIQIYDSNILSVLRQYYDDNKDKIVASGYFFINNRGNRFTEQSIRLMLKKYVKECKITHNITPHMFRHSFATYLIEEGMDISCVQQLLGHSSIKTTQIYIHVAAKKQAELLRALHPRRLMHVS